MNFVIRVFAYFIGSKSQGTCTRSRCLMPESESLLTVLRYYHRPPGSAGCRAAPAGPGWVCGCLLSCHRGEPAEPCRSEGRGTPQERDFEPQVWETGLGGGSFQLGGKTPLRADQGVIINDAADRPGLLPGLKKGSTCPPFQVPLTSAPSPHPHPHHPYRVLSTLLSTSLTLLSL